MNEIKEHKDINCIKDSNGITEKEFLEQYDISRYERPSVTVDILVLTIGEKEKENIRKLPEKELRVLMVKRSEHPYIYKWALPGGFVGINEGLREAAYRKILDEASINNIYLEQLYTLGEDKLEVNRDPRTRVISTSYMALLNQSQLKEIIHQNKDEVKWFSVKKNPVFSGKRNFELVDIYELILESDDSSIKMKYEVKDIYEGEFPTAVKNTVYKKVDENTDFIAFDHYKIIDKGIERLKNKIEYTPLAFTLLGKYFTLSELQKVYEVILNKPLLKANFRRKISSMVRKTDIVQKGGHRPANYYEFNESWKHHFME